MKNSSAAKKAFIYNRIGDFAFLVAMFMVFQMMASQMVLQVSLC
jgi:NADH-quinone oxidoreductase subunit L